ncbi:MAG: hypothetical protein KAS66_05240 [Candidatus Omnitrophica bacterium]|nr:hypothetical protein [Candidatus Omnitrophota bacterium]
MTNEVTEGILPVGTSLKNLDTTIVEQTDGTPAHRETVVIGDPAINGARVNLESELGRYILPVTDPVATSKLICALEGLITEQKITNRHLAELNGETFTDKDLI